MSVLEEKDDGKVKNGPVLFLDQEDKTEEAKKSFTEIGECTYGNKSLGSSGQHEQMTCDCHENWDPTSQKNLACDDDSDCINRLTSVECTNKYGTCGKDCQNQRFQKKQYASVAVFQTEMKGYGLRAEKDIPDSLFIYEYTGEVIDEEAFRKRMVQYDEKNIKHFYFMMLKQDSFIDATRKGSLARFCNHSCNPNAYVDKWVVGEKLRMGIFAKRTIKRGEEITFDYNVDRYGAQKQPCYCGEPNCIKWLGGKTQTDAALLLPDGISEALGVTHKQEKQWLKENKHLRSKQQKENSSVNEAFVKSIEVSPLEEGDVSRVMGALMRSQNLSITQKLIERIFLTDDSYINTLIIRVHGYKTLSQVIKAVRVDDIELVKKILIILSKWPKMTRNKISSSQIEDVVKEINANCEDEELKTLSENLLNEWGNLQMAYRIPKNASNGSSGTPSFFTRSTRSRSPERSQSNEPIEMEDDSLPDGWQVAFDPNTQKPYYYHFELGISRWDRPTKVVPKGPRSKSIEPPKRSNNHGSSTPRGFKDDELAKREEERIRREKEEQFREMREKERRLQELILQSQKEHEEKKSLEEKLRLEKLEKEKERHALKKKDKKPKHDKHSKDKKHSKHSQESSNGASRSSEVLFDQQWTKLFANYVPNLIKKFEADVGRDNIKGCARELVKTLTEKELKKHPDTKAPKELDSAKLKKIKEYCRAFMDKFLIKYKAKHDKKRPHSTREGGDGDAQKKPKLEDV